MQLHGTQVRRVGFKYCSVMRVLSAYIFPPFTMIFSILSQIILLILISLLNPYTTIVLLPSNHKRGKNLSIITTVLLCNFGSIESPEILYGRMNAIP